MALAAFDFHAPVPGQAGGPVLPLTAADAEARQIGLAYARHGLVPPADHLHPGHPVRQGWTEGRARLAGRTRPAGTEVEACLALRLEAWKLGLSFEHQAVTPHLLRQLRGATCPVTRAPLAASGQPAGTATSAGLTRLFLGAGYAAGNLAQLSTTALQARAQLGWEAAWRRAHARGLAAPDAAGADLQPAEWARLAVLLSLATPLDHTQAARLPLLVLPPARVRVLNPVQGLQVVLTLQLLRSGYSRRLNEIAPLLPSDDTRKAFKTFMYTLLAKRLAAGRPVPDPAAARRALENAWAQPEVLRAWTQLSLRLNAVQCEQLLDRMEARGLIDAACRRLPAEAAVDGWALETQGAAVRAAPVQAHAARSAAAGPCAPRPRSGWAPAATQATLPLQEPV